MDINKSYSFEDFEPWSGAVDTWEKLDEFNKISTLEAVLEDLYPDGIDETTLNDLLWFDEESVFEWVGLHYSNNTGEVSEEPLCNVCGDYIPEIECSCGEMICEKCVVKCTKCGTTICENCGNEVHDGEYICDACWDEAG